MLKHVCAYLFLKPLRLCLLFTLLLFTLLLGGLALPQVLLPLLREVAASHGFNVHNARLQVLSYFPYHLHFASDKIESKYAHIQQVNIDYQFNFFADDGKSQLDITLQTLQLKPALITRLQPQKHKNHTHPQPASHRTTAWLPAHWQFKCETCQLDDPRFYVNNQAVDFNIHARGEPDMIRSAFKNPSYGTISAYYEPIKQTLTLQSDALRLPLHWQQATETLYFSQLNAEIALEDLWKSKLTAYLSDNEKTVLHLDLHEWQTPDQQKTLALTLNDNNQYQEKTVLLLKDDGKRYQLQTEALDIAFLNGLLPFVDTLLPADLQRESQGLQLSGHLDAHLSIEKNTSNNTQNHARQLNGAWLCHACHFKTAHYEIGAFDFSGFFADNSLHFATDFQNTRFDIPAIIHTTLTGYTENTFKNNTLSANIHLHNADFERLFGKLIWQMTTDKNNGYLLINADLEKLSLANLQHYLPQKWLSPTLRTFLAQMFVSGKQNKGKFYLKKDNKLAINFNLDIKDGIFNYLANNPRIAIYDAKLQLSEKSMQVDLKNAVLLPENSQKIRKKTAQVPITGSVRIADFEQAALQIDAKTAAASIKQLYEIFDDGLTKQVIHTVKNIATLEGKLAAALHLSLDLSEKNTPFKMRLSLLGEQIKAKLVAFEAVQIQAEKVNAEVDETGLHTLTLSGKNNAYAKSIDVQLQRKNHDYALLIDLKNADALAWLQAFEVIDKPLAQAITKAKLISGDDDFIAHVLLTEKGALQQVEVNSALTKSEIQLFQAIQKKQGDNLPLQVVYQANKTENTTAVQLGTIYLYWQQRKQKKQNKLGKLYLGDKPFKTLIDDKQTPIVVDLKLKQFDTKAAKVFYDHLTHNQLPKNQTQTSQTSYTFPYKAAFQIKIDALKIEDNRKPIAFYLAGNQQNIQIDSPVIKGQLRYQNAKLAAHFQQLEIDTLFDLAKKNIKTSKGKTIKTVSLANQLPVMAIEVDKLIFRGKNIGNATLQTSIEKNNYSIDQLLLNSPNFYLNLSGFEQEEPQGITTHLTLDFKGESLRKISQLLQLNDIFDAHFVDIALSLSWPGRAHTLNLAQSYGKAHLNAEAVEVLSVNSTAGSLFSLMDIVGILKRIAHDFTHLNSQHLNFDRIYGDWNIGGGRAMTQNATAKGSLIDLKIKGGSDLYRHEFDDIDITVIPKASNVLPLIGAVAGGVVGSAAGIVLQQAFGNKINQGIGIHYVLSGGWLDPIIKREGK